MSQNPPEKRCCEKCFAPRGRGWCAFQLFNGQKAKINGEDVRFCPCHAPKAPKENPMKKLGDRIMNDIIENQKQRVELVYSPAKDEAPDPQKSLEQTEWEVKHPLGKIGGAAEEKAKEFLNYEMEKNGEEPEFLKNLEAPQLEEWEKSLEIINGNYEAVINLVRSEKSKSYEEGKKEGLAQTADYYQLTAIKKAERKAFEDGQAEARREMREKVKRTTSISLDDLSDIESWKGEDVVRLQDIDALLKEDEK